jgi:hypothetical protein
MTPDPDLRAAADRRVGGLGVQGIGGDERPKDVHRVEKF